jgi:hypothetical protein
MALREWGPGRLLAAWVAYWAVVALVAAFPFLMQYLRIMLSDGHGTITQSFSLTGLETCAILFGPPLVLWALWLRARPRRDEVASEAPRV